MHSHPQIINHGLLHLTGYRGYLQGTYYKNRVTERCCTDYRTRCELKGAPSRRLDGSREYVPLGGALRQKPLSSHSRAQMSQGAASGIQGSASAGGGTASTERGSSLKASTQRSGACGWTEQAPMASQELVDARDSASGKPSPGVEGGTEPSSSKTCPIHAAASEDTKKSFRKGIGRHNDYVKISVPESKLSRLPMEWWKTVAAFFYAGFNLVLTTVVITVVHERVPPKESSPPLPDKFFDYIDRVKWAFTVTEVNGMVLLAIWIIQLFFFRYKSIACRRFFFLIGTLYLYRCVTMYITTLPVPGMHMTCAPKLHGDSHAKFQRVLQLISGGGLSITNSHLLCGDFLYSGHTVMLTLTYLFIKEYSPRSFWWYHLMCWLLSAVGVVCILVAHEHYSVDVVVAYFITSRLFWWYHTMANLQTLKCSPNNYLTNTWWNPLFNFLERNVQTAVPCSYSWPIPWPPACLKNPCKKYSMVQSPREE